MEVRQLLRTRIECSGEVFEIVNALNDLYREFDGFNRLCIERNPGYERGGRSELVGYRDQTEKEKEIEARKKSEQNKKKSELRHIKKKEAELKKLNKDFKKKYGA